jgi:protein-serine/threonine kinase
MFECLVGYPPFCSDSPNETYKKVVHWRETLAVPQEIVLSFDALDMLRGFVVF